MTAGPLTLVRLALSAPSGLYNVHFKPGVNIIAGPISTGKSSVFQLIDYVFGAQRHPTYEEIAECSDVFLECVVAGQTQTIRRSLHGNDNKARLYDEGIEAIVGGDVSGREVWASYHPSEPTVGKEILSRLGLANIEMKTAPTQSASHVNVLSLRDLLHFIYVDQDRIDSQRNAFYELQAPLAIKWRATFDIFAGLHDQTLTALSLSLQTAQTEHGRIGQYLGNVTDFLRSSRLPEAAVLRTRLAQFKSNHEELLERRQRAHQATQEKLGERLEVVASRDALATEIATAEARAEELSRTITQLTRLRVQYDRERAQLEFLSESQRLIGTLPVSRCPSCLQPVQTTNSTESCYVCHQQMPAAGDKPLQIQPRIAAIARRGRDLERYIEDVRREHDALRQSVGRNRSELERLETTIQRIASVATVPEMRRVMEIDAAVSSVEAEQRTVEQQLEFWTQAERARETLSAVEARIAQLKTDIEKLSADRPSKDAVVARLSEHFRSILAKVKFPALRDVRVDSASYVPVVRGQHYGELSSRGAIALAVAGWHLAVLEYFSSDPGLFLGLIMLDSPLSNVGHDAADEEFRDQQIVNAFYALLNELDANLKGTQLLMCDNRPPAAAESMVIVRFTGDPTRGRVGLIGEERAAAQAPAGAEANPPPSSQTPSNPPRDEPTGN